MIQTTDILNRATQFLAAIPPFNQAQCRAEIQEMQGYVNELNPHNPHGHLLSTRRKNDLEDRMEALFQKMHIKQFPPIPPTPLEMLQEQLNSLEELKGAVNTCTPTEFHKLLKRVHPNLKKKIYEFVWLAYHCPKVSNIFSEEKIKNDTEILKKELNSLVGGNPGRLLDQVEEELHADFCLSQNQGDVGAIINRKVDFFERRRADVRFITHTQMKGFFNAMHAVVQDQLRVNGVQPPFYGRGMNFWAHETFGAHYNAFPPRTTFRVYAPHASQIVLNLTDGTEKCKVRQAIAMQKAGNGEWAVTTDEALPSQTYHFMITGEVGTPPVKKVDPFAFGSVIHDLNGKRENHESVVVDLKKEYAWTDKAWMDSRVNHDFSKQPLNIYEVHSLSWESPFWKLNDTWTPLNWKELAPKLSAYCQDMHYKGVELMGVFSHPQPVSMGYQITNFFSPHPAMGTWEDFQFFVDHMHGQGICVFVDWVPAHFAIDPFALCSFDGKPVFEDDDNSYAYHPQWGTYNFDFKKQFTKDFLSSNAHFILSKLHVDGLRVDAVTSSLYLNYGRPKGFLKRTNRHGSEINLEAMAFYRNLNAYIHKTHPGVITMAEESTAIPNLVCPVTEKGRQVKKRGVGFDMTWDFGWMDGSLKCFWNKNAVERRDLKNFYSFLKTVEEMNRAPDYRPRGKVVVSYSHDENANGEGTILSRMAGKNVAEQFSNGRLALAFQLLRGGGAILDFMGNEILQSREWHGLVKDNSENPLGKQRPSVQWEELDPKVSGSAAHFHIGAQRCRRDLNQLFHTQSGLWDQTDDGISWICAKDATNCVFSLHRRKWVGQKSGGRIEQQFACIFNTTDRDIANYVLELPDASYAPELANLNSAREVYNTDHKEYGGEGRLNSHVDVICDHTGHPTGLELRLPPYTAIVLEESFS